MDDLTTLLARPGFTPGRRHLEPLLDLIGGDEEAAEQASRALLRAGPEVVEAALARLPGAPTARTRARLVRLIGRLALRQGAPPLADRIAPWLDDPDLGTRRQAALALGKLPGGPEVEGWLLARWSPDAPAAFLRALAEALGKTGGPRSRELLDRWASHGAAAPGQPRSPAADDPELRRLVDRARIMLARSAARPDASSPTSDEPGTPGDRARTQSQDHPGRPAAGDPASAGARDEAKASGSFSTPHEGILLRAGSPGAVEVVLRCRRGLEELLLDEGRAVVSKLVVEGPGLLRGTFEGPMLRLASLRIALSFGFPLEPVVCQPGDEARAVVAALTSPRAGRLLKAWSPRPVRFRVAWRDGGHHRAVVWEAARRALEAGLLNDPSRPDWELLVWQREGRLFSELIPRAIGDVRFGYRQGDVPAASHPTVAAALARAGGVREDDVVWDPFVGSGLELCERSRLGPYAELHGSDRDPAAIAVARANLEAAGASAVHLATAEARAHRVPGLSLVLTNPPLGHRVARHDDLGPLLDAVVTSIAHQLRPLGRLVWLAPFAERAAHAGAAAGLEVERRGRVDLGGVEAELQVMRRPRSALPLTPR